MSPSFWCDTTLPFAEKYKNLVINYPASDIFFFFCAIAPMCNFDHQHGNHLCIYHSLILPGCLPVIQLGHRMMSVPLARGKESRRRSTRRRRKYENASSVQQFFQNIFEKYASLSISLKMSVTNSTKMSVTNTTNKTHNPHRLFTRDAGRSRISWSRNQIQVHWHIRIRPQISCCCPG